MPERPRITANVTNRKLIIACKQNKFVSVPKLSISWNFGSGVNWSVRTLFPHVAASRCSDRSGSKSEFSTGQRYTSSRKDFSSVFGRAWSTHSTLASSLTRPLPNRAREGSPRPTHARSLPLTSFISQRFAAAIHRAVESA